MDENRVEGHKVFVTGNGEDFVRMECVNDEDPLTRMVFKFSPQEARDIARSLLDADIAIMAR